MYKIADISDKYGLSKRQVRYRLTQLDELLEGHLSTGKNQAKLIDDYGMSLFDRLMELEGDGRTTSAAANQVKAEIKESTEGEDNGAPTTEDVIQNEIIVNQLQARIEDLKEHNQELRQQLERKDQQIQQLLPAAQEEKKKEEDEFNELGLIQVIKRWFTTKT